MMFLNDYNYIILSYMSTLQHQELLGYLLVCVTNVWFFYGLDMTCLLFLFVVLLAFVALGPIIVTSPLTGMYTSL